jgi:hypothetical protein
VVVVYLVSEIANSSSLAIAAIMPPVPLPTFSELTNAFNDNEAALTAHQRLLCLEDLNPISIRILGEC